MKHTIACLLLLSNIALPFAGLAQGVKECVQEAKDTAEQCINTCVDNKRTDFIECKVPDNDCGAACGNTFLECLEPIDQALDLCSDQCDTDFSTSRTSCGTTCGCTPDVNCGTNLCFFLCLEEPLRVRGTCKVECALDGRPNRKLCRIALKICANAC